MIFKGLGSLLGRGVEALGDVGHFAKYATGFTGQELKAAGRASSKKVGRILGREEQRIARQFNRSEQYAGRVSSRVTQVSRVERDAATGKYTNKGLGYVKEGPFRVAENTARYERAYASRQRAINFGLNRLLPAAGFYAAGQIGGAIIENRAEMQRAYRGRESYDAMYGTSAQTAASIVRGAGTFLGIQSLLGINPVQEGIATVKKFKKFRKAAAVAKRAKRLSTMQKVSEVAASEKYLKPKGISILTADYVHPSGTMFRQFPGSSVPVNLGSKAGETFVKGKAKALKTATKRMESIIKFGPNFLTAAGVTAGAGVAAGALYAPGLTAIVALAPEVAKAFPITRAAGRFVARYPVSSMLGVGALGAGAAIGMSRTHYPAAEGNISDVSYGRESATTKLNYSTAGIVQSIHNNRRRM